MTDTTPDYAGLEALEQAIIGYWGNRCSDFDGNCPCCQSWKQFDALRTLLERNTALERYAREATIAITGLTVGGSEFFGKRIGDMYTADLPYCVERIRERMGYRMDQLRAEAERDRLAERVAELERERNQLLDKLHCMCGSPIDHSAWEGHTPVSVYDYSLDQERSRAEAAEARLAEARRLIRSTHKRAVTHANCEDEFCAICVGGLFVCADCGAVEAEAEERICTGGKEHP